MLIFLLGVTVSRASRFYYLVLTLALPVLINTGCGNGEKSDSPNEITYQPSFDRVEEFDSISGSEKAIEFPANLEWLNTSEPVFLRDLRGKIVLIDFWTYGCINCLHNFPELQKIQAEYPDVLAIVGIHSGKFQTERDSESISRIVDRFGLEHPVANDSNFDVWDAWGVYAWPTLALIDPAGNIVTKWMGEGFYDTFKEYIELLLEEFSGSGLVDTTPVTYKKKQRDRPTGILSFPSKITADHERRRLYIADSGNFRILETDLDSNEILRVVGSGRKGFSDGSFPDAQFRNPLGLALSSDARFLFVADTDAHAVRMVDLAAESVVTIAGTGVGRDVLRSPWDLAVAGDTLYIAMAGTHQIRAMDIESNELRLIAGSGVEAAFDGIGADAALAQPSGLSVGDDGYLYFAEAEASTIRRLDMRSLMVETLAGGYGLFDYGTEDGEGRSARFQHPLGIVVEGTSAYVADSYNHRIRRLDLETMIVSTLAGSEAGWSDGPDPLFFEPGGLVVVGDSLFVADTNNHSIRKIDLKTGETTTLVIKTKDPFFAADLAVKPLVLRREKIRVGGSIIFDLLLPDGYKVNEDAYSSISLSSASGQVEFSHDGEIVETGLEFPLEIEVLSADGDDALTVEFSIVYCEKDKETLCFIEKGLIELPVSFRRFAPSSVRISHTIELPAASF